MKKITLLFVFMLTIVTGSYGQAGSYSFSESTEVYTPVVGTNSTAAGDDGIQNLVPIGFTFTFDNVAYTDFGISTNGWIKMGIVAIGGSSWTNLLSNTAIHRPIIAPLWDDNHRNTGSIQYSLSGTTPNQILEVGWDNINIGGGGSTSAVNLASFKLRLYETSNVIEFVYGPTLALAGTLSASVGINGAASFLSVTPGVTSTASSGAANNAINATTNLVGKKYIFTPPVPCTGTPVGGIVTPASRNLCTGSAVGNLVGSGYTSGVAGLNFQWEESPDGIAPWVNAVGGTGATTATYTPPVYSGTPIQYRLNVTCSNSGLSASSVPSLIGNPATPITQVSNANATNLQLTAATINWTVGVGGGRRVVVVSDSPITDPTDGNAAALVANTVYAGTGQQIMYDGIAATVNITGLTQNTSYFVKVYEYLRCGAGPYDYYYNVSTGTNAFTFTTPVPPANDDCSGAIPVTVGNIFADYALTTSNVGATASQIADPTIPAPGCSSYLGGDVWHSVEVPISGNLKIETGNSIGSTIVDTGLAVYSGVCGALALVSCDDDASANGFFSLITITGRTPGEVLYIRTFEYQNNAFDNYQISAYDCSSTLPAPTGDAAQEFCNSATVADLVTTSGTGIKWYDADIAGTLLLSTDALVSGNTYYASQTLVCEGLQRLAVTVTITATPADPTAAVAQTFCPNASPDLTTLAVTSGGTGLVWYDAATLGNVLPETTVLTATTYYVSSIDGTCESGRLAITTTEDCPAEVCLGAVNGQWPSNVFVPDSAQCDGFTAQEIVTDGFASEYSMVTVVSGETYVFKSSIATDIITIGTDDGATAFTSGVGSVTWIASISGDVRFYTHLTGCGASTSFRTRSVTCGILSTDLPDYANLQFPSTLTFVQGGSGTVYGQVYEAGLTNVEPGYTGQAAGITAWVGVSPEGSNTNPNTWTEADWTPATWNSLATISNNDEYQATIGATLAPGIYYYATRFRLNAGGYVYGGIDGSGNGNFWNGTTHNSGVLTVTALPAPANDDCSGAIALIAGGIFADHAVLGTNVSATNSIPADPSCASYLGSDVWYSIAVPASGTLTLETGSGSVTDTGLAVYQGDCSTLVEYDCDDDAGVNAYSKVVLSALTPGEVLYVRVWAYDNNESGTFQVSGYDGSLATTSFDSANFTYYPNPVKNMLNLSYTQNISSVGVYNLLGQEVVSKVVNANQSQIDMSDLPTGAYLVKVTSDNQVKTIKVMKE